MSVELKVGQVWKDREGREVTIAKKANNGDKESQYDLIELVQDENGWRPWKATADSVCPVSDSTLVSVRTANGESSKCPNVASDFVWGRRGDGYEITAYSIVLKAPQATEPAVPGRTPRRHPHYFKDVSQINEIDVYRVCELFGVDDPSGATQHAVKKLLCAGQRGAKDRGKDYQEAIDTLTRRVEMWVEGQQ